MGQQLNVITGQSKQEEAIDFIRQHEPPEGYFLGFSGGKDSTVLKHLSELSGVKFKAYYSATGIDPPEVVHFIKKYHSDVVFCRPSKSFYEFMQTNGMPRRVARWCCKDLKSDPTSNIELKHRLMGIRAEESAKRSKRDRVEIYTKSSKKQMQTIYKPIFGWTEYDVWDHIDRHSLPYCKLYDEGFDRIGCVVCPFLCQKNEARINRNKKRWPGMFKAFEKAAYELWEDREWYRQKVQGKAMLFEEFLDNWYKGK
jgi:phosphoadenosine phosphosulfate reductase